MKFVMNRDRVVVTRLGRSFEFKKNEPLHVPPMCWAEVQAAGAAPEEDLPEDSAKSTVPTGEARTAAITEAMKAMVVEGVREHFTAAGAPHTTALSQKLGFAVDAKERDAVWTALSSEN